MRFFPTLLLMSLGGLSALAADLPRDGTILADPGIRTYLLYASAQDRVIAYRSRDLKSWEGPSVVWNGSGLYPRVHLYRGKYYLLLTMADRDKVLRKPPESWQQETAEGVRIFVADSPLGPFAPAGPPLTPAAFMAYGGTLYVEGDLPWLVYVHDSHQLIDANIEAVRLNAELSAAVEDPLYLFKASDAPRFREQRTTSIEPRVYSAFSPVLYRTRAGSLLMLWSQSGVAVARSVSGKIRGPWVQDRVLSREGSGMISMFRAFDGRLMVRADGRFLELEDTGDTVRVKGGKE